MNTSEKSRLTFLSMSHRDKSYRMYCKYLCDCGNITTIRSDHVNSGRIQSCGCLHKDAGIRQITHGMSGTLTYRSWAAMIDRCYNPNHPTYNRYGGRGIKVCERWLDPTTGPLNLLFDLGERPSELYSLDRYPNNDGDYEPGNCRWATDDEQYGNQSSNRLLTYQDRTQTVSAWAREKDMAKSTLLARLKRGWSIEKSLSLPVDHRFSKA